MHSGPAMTEADEEYEPYWQRGRGNRYRIKHYV